MTHLLIVGTRIARPKKRMTNGHLYKNNDMETITINEEYIRLDSLMKFSGLCNSGGRAKYLIQNGEVKLNGEVCTMRGKKCRNGDRVEYQNRTVEVAVES